ncbi:MAG: ABC transporter permease [Pseudomonadota bacterium]
MASEIVPQADAALQEPRRGELLRLLWGDKFAAVSAIWLILVIACALFAPMLLDGPATAMDLRARNAPPFELERGFFFILGGDALGRSILARLAVAAQNTIGIATAAVACAMLIGGFLGLIAGYVGGWIAGLIMRLADVVMSFPSLLLAVVVLYIFEPSVISMIFVLAFTRIPLYLRTTRAEVLEIRERVFVAAAQVMGAGSGRILRRHILPLVIPTLITIATLDFAFVMLVESALSFLGIGIQPPEMTWGLMVSQGRSYLSTAWWLAFWPGLMIILTTMSLNLLSNWLRTVTDPEQRWRLEIGNRP